MYYLTIIFIKLGKHLASAIKKRKENTVSLCARSIAQSYLILCDHMDCSPPGSSVREIFQARILEWVAISFSSLTHGNYQINVCYTYPV